MKLGGPYVPPHQKIMVRTSERTCYTRCRQKWVWAYVERLSPKRQYVGSALTFGDLIHQALAAYYIPELPGERGRGPHPAQTFLDLYDKLAPKMMIILDPEEEDEKEEDPVVMSMRQLGEMMMINYIDHYGADDRYVIIQPEMPFQYRVRNDFGRVLGTYVGTCDALIYDMNVNQYGLFEHKTAKAISTRHLTLDEQAGTYWTFIPLIMKESKAFPKGAKFDFILYNFMLKKPPDTRPKNALGQSLNKNGTVSKRQPPPRFHRHLVYRTNADRKATYDRIRNQMVEMQLVRAGVLAVTKTPTRNCSWDCEFVDMCELHEQGEDWESYRDSVFTTWKPYEVHEHKG